MIEFAICDDEPFARDDLAGRIAEYMGTRSYRIISFASGEAVLDSGKTFDVLFLDLQMGGLGGMETAKRLREQGYQGILVFITVLKESVFDAFAVEAFDYLVKPLDGRRFRQTMDRAVQSLGHETNLVLRKGTACRVVPFSQIIYGEVLGRKIYLHKRGGETIDYYEALDDLERRADSRFFRCHRSYLVNLDYVRGCKAGAVLLSEGGEIPVSRLRERALAQALLAHMKQRRC